MNNKESDKASEASISNSKSFLDWFFTKELSKADYDAGVVSILLKHLKVEKPKVSAGKDISRDLKDLAGC